jgi:hypothetical protein
MGELAPIAVFSFRRPRHLAATLEALQRCPEFSSSEVVVYSDGPRGPSDEAGVNEVRELLRARKTPNMTIVERPTNVGLANSIIGAVTETTQRAGKVIVIEDDLVLQPSALSWLNAGLTACEHQDQVMQISAYQYRVPEFADRREGSFQRFATTWGWATWQRAWEKFDARATGWEEVRDDPAVRDAFDAGGVYPFSDMLQKQMAGKIDSWGIRWSWSVFRNKGLTLMPPRSLVKNTGLDGSGTHSTLGPLKRFVSAPHPLQWQDASPPALPAEMVLNNGDEAAFRRALKNTHALRNHNIKKSLAKMGFKRFAAQ